MSLKKVQSCLGNVLSWGQLVHLSELHKCTVYTPRSKESPFMVTCTEKLTASAAAELQQQHRPDHDVLSFLCPQ